MKETILTVIASTLLISAVVSAKGGRGGRDDDNAAINSIRPPKSSAIGKITESIEHSTRILYAADQAIAEQVVAASGDYDAAKQQVVVVIELQNGSLKNFLCVPFTEFSQGGTVKKTEMRCLEN